MKLSWIEDYLVLVDAGSFSRAAAMRHISQPAFSRRIRKFEQWLGVDLVDRTSPHLQRTPVAARFEQNLRELADRAEELRTQMRIEALAERRITLTTQHTLMVTHLPRLLRVLQPRLNGIGFWVRACNRKECVARFVEGRSDLLMCFEDPNDPVFSDASAVECVRLGRERMVPVIACGVEIVSSDRSDGAFRLLGYPQDSFFGQVIRTRCLPDIERRYGVETVCESAFTAGLKEMALAGMGVAWLPHALVSREISEGKLRPLHDMFETSELMIVVYGRRNGQSLEIDTLWQTLRRTA